MMPAEHWKITLAIVESFHGAPVTALIATLALAARSSRVKSCLL
jgi:hypothetical protein